MFLFEGSVPVPKNQSGGYGSRCPPAARAHDEFAKAHGGRAALTFGLTSMILEKARTHRFPASGPLELSSSGFVFLDQRVLQNAGSFAWGYLSPIGVCGRCVPPNYPIESIK